MHKKVKYSINDHLQESLKNPEFRQAWEKSEPEYLLSCRIIEARLKNKLSQRALAKKAGTTQAIVSRIETMTANPSLSLMKRLAAALDYKLSIAFEK